MVDDAMSKISEVSTDLNARMDRLDGRVRERGTASTDLMVSLDEVREAAAQAQHDAAAAMQAVQAAQEKMEQVYNTGHAQQRSNGALHVEVPLFVLL